MVKREDQDVKSEFAVKSESVEVKKEQLEIDPKGYEAQFNTVAAGLIADELPGDIIDTFIKHVEGHVGPVLQSNGAVKSENHQLTPDDCQTTRSAAASSQINSSGEAKRPMPQMPYQQTKPSPFVNNKNKPVKKKEIGMSINQSTLCFKKA